MVVVVVVVVEMVAAECLLEATSLSNWMLRVIELSLFSRNQLDIDTFHDITWQYVILKFIIFIIFHFDANLTEGWCPMAISCHRLG